ncbi:histidine phosphatase family protein [Kitasatospora sp. NPDC097643]|uniref:SixA phosphatase family protein n=1 Tax=Kitasatospora sp. NPDC097643 TaxID=3157230 RepID=UPI003326C614
MSTGPTRTIVVLRHAKAEPHRPEDHGRHLAERGRSNAPQAGRWLAGRGIAPDLALVSTAARTRETWELAAAELPAPPEAVYDDRLYDADLDELITVLRETPDGAAEAVVVGHNPGMHGLADYLAGACEPGLLPWLNASGFPTCAVAVLTFTGPWTSLDEGVARLVAYWTPREGDRSDA